LIKDGIATPQHLGIRGGSNGGLLMGVALTQHPELYNAVLIQNPLLDMKRYNHLLAGASWMAEYGNPDKPEEWAYISRYSPYQNLKPGTKYPTVMFTTATRDDRVHPGTRDGRNWCRDIPLYTSKHPGTGCKGSRTLRSRRARAAQSTCGEAGWSRGRRLKAVGARWVRPCHDDAIAFEAGGILPTARLQS
jgi:hypothetical protein